MSYKHNRGDEAETVWKKIFTKAQKEIGRFNENKLHRITKNKLKTRKKNLF